jgi:CRISPR-associated protein Cmr2
MTHLFLVAIGPVQDFIAAARRTADLQAGSRLLVSIAKTVAEALRDDYSAELIFPALKKPDDPIEDPPNKILVALPEGKDPCEIAAKLKAKALRVLDDAWSQAWGQIDQGQRSQLDENRAKAQLARFLEFYAAWVPLEGDYAEARKAVERKLAGRKALREFEATEEDDKFLPKSALDPAWPTVVKLPEGIFNIAADSPLAQTPIFLKSSEVLDAISLIKRVNGHLDSDGTPSTATMAIRLLEDKFRTDARYEKLKALEKRCRPTLDYGDLFFETRVQEEQKRRQTHEESLLNLNEIAELRRHFLKIAEYSSPPPYYAILLADGDRMGRIISKKDSKEAHQAFSLALAGFAGAVGGIVEKNHGHLIYSGGDDVLALLPLHTAIKCAHELHEEFDTRMKDVKAGIEGEAVGTLSAGIAIVHYREPLQISLERARRAEKAAKDAGRDALAVALHTRGGAPVTYAAPWGDGKLKAAWDLWTEAFDGKLSRGLPYELRAFAQQAMGVKLPSGAFQKEAARIFARKEGGKAFLESNPNALDGATSHGALEALAGMLVIARFLARPEGEGR